MLVNPAYFRNEMAAFDSLPAPVRKALSSCPIPPMTAQEAAMRLRAADRQVKAVYGPQYHVDPASFAEALLDASRRLCLK